jgi:hypothetical protein
MEVAAKLIALTALLFVAQEVLRRAGRWVLWGAFLALPAALTPYWVRVNEIGTFPWIKLYTLLVSVCWFTALRFSALGDRPRARAVVALLLAVNVVEAAALDLLGRGPAHLLNGVAGLLLVATLPRAAGTVRIDAARGRRDLHCNGIGRAWVVAFSVWNGTFVYLNYPQLAGHQAAVLASGLIVAALDPRRWLQARAYTLGADLIVQATFCTALIAWADTSSWSDPGVELGAAATALVLVSGCAARTLRAWDGRPAAARPAPLPRRVRAGIPARAARMSAPLPQTR